MNKDEFIKELNKININITEKQYQQLEQYYELLISYNKIHNLTAITDKKDVFLKHFYDSLTVTKAIDFTKDLSICDIGTGAGFPGLVLKIIFPNLKVILVDSLKKRINFLDIVIEKLDLKEIYTIHQRAEDFSKNNIEQFDIVTSRAVAKINIILEITSQIIKVNGFLILLKGNIIEELEESKNAIKTLDFTLNHTYEFKLPVENSKRTILKLTKLKHTNKKYPREISKIKKKPL